MLRRLKYFPVAHTHLFVVSAAWSTHSVQQNSRCIILPLISTAVVRSFLLVDANSALYPVMKYPLRGATSLHERIFVLSSHIRASLTNRQF